MSWFSSKKRPKRVETKRSGSLFWNKIQASLNDKGTLSRLFLSFMAIIVTLVLVQAWQPPFPYRKGDRADHGLAAEVRFRIVDKSATSRAIEEARKEVLPIFRNDTTVLEGLPDKLRAYLGSIAEAEDLDELSPEVRDAFGMTLPKSKDDSEPEPGKIAPEFAFEQLKQAVNPIEGAQSETQISSIVEDFTTLIKPLLKTGLIDKETLDRIKDNNLINLEVDSSVAIISEEEINRSSRADERQIDRISKIWVEARLVDIQLTDLLNDAGLIGQEWRLYSTLEPIREQMVSWLTNQKISTLKYDQAHTQAARRFVTKNVENVHQDINAGDEIIPPGAFIEDESLAKLNAEFLQIQKEGTWYQKTLRVLIVFALLLVLAMINGYFLNRNDPKLLEDTGKITVYLFAFIAAVAVGRWLSFDPFRAEVLPVVVIAMVFAIAYGQQMATLSCITISLIVSLATRLDLEQFAVLMSASAIAVMFLSQIQSSSKIILSGFFSGVAYFAVAYGLVIIRSQSLNDVFFNTSMLFNTLKGAGWCLFAGFFVAGTLPFIEKRFGFVSGISLLEMSNLNQPLLQELIRQAPGTYNHSISVATIGEAAAEKIGANGLLVRIGAYFHDIGKIPKAEYFIENQSAEKGNRHDNLAPAMSTLIIIGHVKDGVEMAKQENLPQVIIDFIEQHHGTTLVEYFYNTALKNAENDEKNDETIEESSFRYPGPKPQSREAGVLMLSDAVESASRTLSEPTPGRIERLVHDITMKKLLDGQFDESSLTLGEIHIIEESLIKSLSGMYHARIAYPERSKASKAS